MRLPPPTAPMIPVAAAFASGIAAATVLGIYWYVAFIVLILTLSICLRRIYLLLLCICFVSGGLDYVINAPIDTIGISDPAHYTAIVDRVSDGRSSVVVTAHVCEINNVDIADCGVNLIMPSTEPDIMPGDRIVFNATLTPVEDNHDLPDEFEGVTYLLRRGIMRSGIVVGDSIEYIVPDMSIRSRLLRLQGSFSSIVKGSRMSDVGKEFLLTCLLGEPDIMVAERRESYNAAGLSHILALSGLHVAILTLIISLLLIPVRQYGRIYWIPPALTILLLWSFALITGMSTSVVRAVIMATVISVGMMLERRSSTANSLALASFLILLISPVELFSIGFQLSVAGVAGIIMFAPHFIRYTAKRGWLFRVVGGIIATSASAIIVTTVFSAYYFNAVPLLSLPANCIVIPILLPAVLFIGILLIIALMLGHEMVWLCKIEDTLIGLIDRTTELFGSSDWNVIHLGDIGLVGAALAIVALILLKIWLDKRRIVWLASAIMTASLSLSACAERKLPDRGLETYFVQRHGRYAEIYVRHDTSLYLISTAPEGELEGLRDAALRRYGRYMRRRCINDITLVGDTFSEGIVDRRGRWLTVGDKTILMAVHNNLPYLPESKRPRIDYVVVAPTFKGSISDVLEYVNADSIICPSRWINRQMCQK